MNRQEFAAAYREARKVLVFHAAMREAGITTGAATSLLVEMDDRVFHAANERNCAWDVLTHPWYRFNGGWSRYSRLPTFCRPVRLPGSAP